MYLNKTSVINETLTPKEQLLKWIFEPTGKYHAFLILSPTFIHVGI
jgi:hypothetical protein